MKTKKVIKGDDGVLFHCYKCHVDMVRVEDSNGTPTFQCPVCQETAKFHTPELIIKHSLRYDSSVSTKISQDNQGSGTP